MSVQYVTIVGLIEAV